MRPQLRVIDTNRPEVPLTSTAAERGLIACVVDAGDRRPDHDVIARVGGASLVPMFQGSKYRATWELLCQRHAAGLPNDSISVAEALQHAGIMFGELSEQGLGITGWLNDLGEVLAQVPTSTLAPRFAAEIKLCAWRREAITHTEALLDELRKNPAPPKAFFEERMSPLLGMRTPDEKAPTWDDTVREIMRHVERVMESPNGTIVSGVSSGIFELDAFTGGLANGELIVVGGRPSMGKTAFGVTLAVNAMRDNVPVCFVSAEMTRERIGFRILSQFSRVENQRLRLGPLLHSDYSRAVDGAGRMMGLPLTIVAGKRNWHEVMADVRMAVAAGAKLVVMDYLGMFDVPEYGASQRVQMTGRVTKDAKMLATNANVPVVMLSQLNRESAKRDNQKPTLTDLRESGEIEQDADTVLFPHREHYYNQSAPEDQAELIVAKMRDGRVGSVWVKWNPETARFSDLNPPPMD